jgi:UBX domain
VSAQPAAPAHQVAAKATANHTTARIQIRPQGIPGAPPAIVKQLSATDTLTDLAESLLADGLSGYSIGRAKFMQVYPRKEYARSEWGKSLKDLGGLVPSGTLMLLLA